MKGSGFVKRFKKIYIEITNICNLACIFCPKTTRAPATMRAEEFREILDQVKSYTDYVYLHVMGEPLLHPELSLILDICEEKGIWVNLTTNGTLIPLARTMLLAKPALRQVNVSLHSLGGETTLQCQDEYLAAILSFAKEASATSNLIISLRIWNLQKDASLIFENRRNDRLFSSIEKTFGLTYRINEENMPSRGMQIADRVYVNLAHQFTWPTQQAATLSRSAFCYGLRNQVAILVDGTVVPCCLDSEGIINLGNIHRTALADILDSPRARNLYNGFSRKESVEALCQTCGYRERFD